MDKSKPMKEYFKQKYPVYTGVKSRTFYKWTLFPENWQTNKTGIGNNRDNGICTVILI